MSRITVREQADGKLVGWQPSTDPAHRGVRGVPPPLAGTVEGSCVTFPSVSAPEFLYRCLTVPHKLSADSSEGLATRSIGLGKAFVSFASLSTNFLTYAVSGIFYDRSLLRTALNVTLDVAGVRSCSSLANFALQTAGRLGFTHAEVAVKDSTVVPAAVSSMPAVVSDLFNSHCLVHVGVVSGGRVWNTFNPAMTEYVANRGVDKENDLEHASIAHVLARMLWRLVDSDEERTPMLRAMARVLHAPLSPVDSTSEAAQAEADEVLMLSMKRSSSYVHGLSSLGVPMEEAPDESVVVPHRYVVRLVRVKDAASGCDALIYVGVDVPAGADGRGIFQFESGGCLGRRKRALADSATYSHGSESPSVSETGAAEALDEPPQAQPEMVRRSSSSTSSARSAVVREGAIRHQRKRCRAASPPALSSVSEEELLTVLDSEEAADRSLVSQMLAMIG